MFCVKELPESCDECPLNKDGCLLGPYYKYQRAADDAIDTCPLYPITEHDAKRDAEIRDLKTQLKEKG